MMRFYKELDAVYNTDSGFEIIDKVIDIAASISSGIISWYQYYDTCEEDA